MKRGVARRMAGRADKANAGRDFGFAVDLTDVLPGRKHAPGCGAPNLCALPAGGRSPHGSVQHLYSVADTTISAFGNTGVLVSFSISPKM